MPAVDQDIVIIGGGPAGLTAGLYAARSRLNVVLFERSLPGGQVLVTDWVDNYPGFPKGISGPDLVGNMTAQAERFGLVIRNDVVMSVDLADPVKRIHLSGSTISAHTVIIATGASPKKLGIPGEAAFWGKGISACATCDGPFYRDRTVAAVGGGDTAVQESIFLTKFAKKVHLFHRRDHFKAQKILQEQAFSNPKIEIHWNTVVTGVSGLSKIESVHARNVVTGDSLSLTVDAFFVWIGIEPDTAFLGDALDTDQWGFIRTNDRMETSVPGVFAAGDVRSTTVRQIATAVGDAAVAAYSCEHYIERVKK